MYKLTKFFFQMKRILLIKMATRQCQFTITITIYLIKSNDYSFTTLCFLILLDFVSHKLLLDLVTNLAVLLFKCLVVLIKYFLLSSILIVWDLNLKIKLFNPFLDFHHMVHKKKETFCKHWQRLFVPQFIISINL